MHHQRTGQFKPFDAAEAPVFTPWRREARPVFVPWNANDPGMSPVEDVEAADAPDLAEAREAAYAEGFTAARATIEAELAAERVAVAALAESLQSLRPEPAGPLALLLVETVDRLVRQVVGEVAIDPTLLLARAHAAAALIVEESRPSSLRLNPADHARIEGATLPVAAIADASVAPGSVVLESAEGWIEDGVGQRLDSVRAALLRIAA